MVISGRCDPAFARVQEALAENLADEGEFGEAVAVVVDGEIAVDLWGGFADPARTRAWAEDTLVCMFSVGKPIAALPLLALIDRGDVGLDDRVAKYWPEYAQNGKAETTIDHIVSHQAGIPGLPDASRGSAYDWQAMIAAIEVQAPMWPPGSTGCYHTFTYGHLVGELARRITGKPIGQLVRDVLAEPFGIDFAFGLDAAQQARCADVVATPGDPLTTSLRDPETLIGRCWHALPLGPGEEDFNSTRCRAAEMPAFNGHGTARAVARLYAILACGGALDGRRLLSEAMVATATTERWSGPDALGLNSRMARGFRLSNDYAPFTGNPRAFGHTGIGGAIAFADPDRRLGFCFTPNRLAPGPGTSVYAKRLIDALTACLA